MWPRLAFLQCLPTAKRWKWPTFPLGSGLPLGCVSPAESKSKITRPTLFPIYDQFLILLSKVIHPPILEHYSLKETLVLLSQELLWLIQVALLKEMQWLGIFTRRLDCVSPAGEKGFCSLGIGTFAEQSELPSWHFHFWSFIFPSFQEYKYMCHFFVLLKMEVDEGSSRFVKYLLFCSLNDLFSYLPIIWTYKLRYRALQNSKWV